MGLVLCLVLAVSAGRPLQGEPDRELVERMAAMLVDPSGSPRPLDDMVRDLARLGPTGIPAAFTLLDAGRLPGPEGEPLQDDQGTALRRSLAGFGRAALGAELERRWADAEKPLAPTLSLLADVGTGADLERLVERLKERRPRSSVEHRALEDALAGMTRRAGLAPAGLRSDLLWAPDELAGDFVRAVARLDPEPAAELFVSVLGLRPELDRTLVQAIGSLAGEIRRPVDESLLEPLRRCLASPDEPLVRAAVQTLGELEDFQVAPFLIRRLRGDTAAERSEAERALETLSGRRFGPDPARWTTWLASESAWFRQRVPALVAQLDSADAVAAAHALNELSQRTYRRHDLAQAMLAGLASDDDRLRARTCLALERLGSTSVLASLVPLLDDPDEGTARAAWHALRTLSHQDLPATPTAWLSWIQGVS